MKTIDQTFDETIGLVKFQIEKKILLNELNHLKHFTHLQNDLITQNLFFTVSNNKLQIIATNLDSWLTSIIPIKNLSIEKTAIFTIDAKTLIKIIKTIKSNELIFNYSINDFKLQLAFEETIITMNCHEEQTASFPQQPIAKQNDNCSFYLYSQELFQALKTTSFAASNDDLRPALNNININNLNNDNDNDIKLTFAATDAHKLVVYEINNPISLKHPLNVNATEITKFLNVLKKANKLCMINYNTEIITFAFNNKIFTTSLFPGQFPNYQAVIPKNQSYKIRIDKNLLINIIERLKPLTTKKTNSVKFITDNGRLNVFTFDEETNNSGCDFIPISGNFPNAYSFIFNYHYLLEILKNCPSNFVMIYFSEDNNKPFIIKPIINNEVTNKITYLLMPMDNN